jgi:hypothetical protein
MSTKFDYVIIDDEFLPAELILELFWLSLM